MTASSRYFTKSSIVFFNGKFRKATDARCLLYGQSLHYGNSVFEGIRAYGTENGIELFKPKEHYERMLFGARLMNLAFDYTVSQLIDITYQLLEKNKLREAYVRPLILTGPDMSLKSSDETEFVMQCWPWGKYMGDRLLGVCVSSYQRPNPRSCHIEAKITGHYVNSILATNEARAKGYDEALLTDLNGNIAEGTGANFFFEKEGKLFTAPQGHILPGITRSVVMDLCRQESISVRETFFTEREVKQAHSAFFTGTAAEITGISCLDNTTLPLPWEKSLGYRLSALYRQLVIGKYRIAEGGLPRESETLQLSY